MTNDLRRRDSSADSRGLLQRILDTPHIERIVPTLQPEVLHRVIETCGLEECGDLIALATPDQLQRVFDLDLWRPERPGLDEALDADGFGVWLEVLMESGAEIAAAKLLGMNIDLIVSGLAQHISLFHRAAVAPIESGDGDEPAEIRKVTDALSCEVGGFLVESRRTNAWDAIVELLVCLDSEHPDYFRRLLRRLCQLSNEGFELDGLDELLSDRDQEMFDLASDREIRREKQGYVLPSEARAFLQMTRDLAHHTASPHPNPLLRAYFNGIEAAEGDKEETMASSAGSPAAQEPTPASVDSDGRAMVTEILTDAGILTSPRFLLNPAREEPRPLARLHRYLEEAARDGDTFSKRTAELAYLGNALLSGCSIQARSFTPREASDAAAASCNLGFENWPADSPEPEDLVMAFQLGWKVLYDDVCMFAARRLLDVLKGLKFSDRHIQAGIEDLRFRLRREWLNKTPWRAREAFDVLTSVDMPAWAALLGLIDECPVIHGAMRALLGTGRQSVDPSAFEFIAENSQIAAVTAFMESLPRILEG